MWWCGGEICIHTASSRSIINNQSIVEKRRATTNKKKERPTTTGGGATTHPSTHTHTRERTSKLYHREQGRKELKLEVYTPTTKKPYHTIMSSDEAEIEVNAEGEEEEEEVTDLSNR